MDRQLDANGFDVSDETEGRSFRRPALLVGAIATAVIATSAGMVAVALSDDESEHVAHAADATVVTALGHTVTGGSQATAAALPVATAALNGMIAGPTGLSAGQVDVIPERVLASYRSAEAALARDAPECRVPWWLLAGIGKVETNHAAGGQVDASGTTTSRIVGPRLDGTAVGGRVTRDTDDGELDGDLTFDRGVGPMLIVPQTWAGIGRDGNGDGVADVSNADDAAVSVGTVLCSAGTDLMTRQGLAAGLVEFDDTATFPGEVLPWAVHYRTAVPAATPSSTPSGTSTGTATTIADPSTGAAPGKDSPASGTPTRTTTPTSEPVTGRGFTTQPADAPPSATPPAVPPRPRTTAPAPVAPAPVAPAPVAPARPTARPTTPRPTTPSPSAPRPQTPVTRSPQAPRPTVPAVPVDPPSVPVPTRPVTPAPDRPRPPAQTPRPSAPQETPSAPAQPAPSQGADNRGDQRQQQQRREQRQREQQQRREERQRQRDQNRRDRQGTPPPSEAPSNGRGNNGNGNDNNGRGTGNRGNNGNGNGNGDGNRGGNGNGGHGNGASTDD